MRKNLRYIYEYDFTPLLVKNIYRLVDDRKVRNIDTIVSKVVDYFTTRGMHDIVFDYYYLAIDREQRIYDVVYSIIMSIEEIKDLNLTEEEFKAGLHYSSPERKYFTAQGKKFVDIIALVQNFTYDLNKEIKEKECRLCTVKNCNNCTDNNKFFVKELAHEGKVCKLDCPEGYWICCNDCKESCLYRCYKDGKKCEN